MSLYEPNRPLPNVPEKQSCTTCASVPPNAHASVVIGLLVTFRASRVPRVCLYLACSSHLISQCDSIYKGTWIGRSLIKPSSRLPCGWRSSGVHRLWPCRSNCSCVATFFWSTSLARLATCLAVVVIFRVCGAVIVVSFNSALRRS